MICVRKRKNRHKGRLENDRNAGKNSTFILRREFSAEQIAALRRGNFPSKWKINGSGLWQKESSPDLYLARRWLTRISSVSPDVQKEEQLRHTLAWIRKESRKK